MQCGCQRAIGAIHVFSIVWSLPEVHTLLQDGKLGRFGTRCVYNPKSAITAANISSCAGSHLLLRYPRSLQVSASHLLFGLLSWIIPICLSRRSSAEFG